MEKRSDEVLMGEDEFWSRSSSFSFQNSESLPSSPEKNWESSASFTSFLDYPRRSFLETSRFGPVGSDFSLDSLYRPLQVQISSPFCSFDSSRFGTPWATGGNSRGFSNDWQTQTQSRDISDEFYDSLKLALAAEVECLQKPVTRNKFEFPETGKAFSLQLYTCGDCNKVVNSDVDFVIQLNNVPKDVQLEAYMLEAIVEDPSGKRSSCQVGRRDTFLVHSFLGSFHAEDVFGTYRVQVRAVIPLKIFSAWDGNTGVVSASLEVFVSRNYFKDSQTESLFILCPFQSVSKSDTAEKLPSKSKRREHSHRRHYPAHPPCKLWGLACDLRTNNLYYTDRAAHEVVCISPRGEVMFKFGQDSCVEREKLFRPTGIAYDNVNHRLVVVDKDNHRVVIFSMEGKFTFSFGAQGHMNGLFNFPWGVSVSPDGEYIVVADSKNKRIQLFDKFGIFVKKYSVFETKPFEYKENFDFPRDVSFDETGKNIYVTDFNLQNVIQLPLDLSGQRILAPSGKLRRPSGIAVDSTGNILTVDSRNNCIRQMSSNGDLLASIREIQGRQLQFPLSVAVMAGGWLAVLEGCGKMHIF